jgi:putative phage-type endonuclease
MLTASDAATAIGENPYETPDGLFIKKVGGRKFGGNAATARGTLLEPIARDMYDERFGRKSHEIGLVQHPVHKWLGGSPDGITECGRLIEIKCPLTRKIEDKVPKHYVAQIQLCMEILDLDQCDFIQFRPAENGAPEEFVVTNVKRDRVWFERALPVMKAFWDRVLEGRKVGLICEVISEEPVLKQDGPVCQVLDDQVRFLQEEVGDSGVQAMQCDVV